MGVDCDSVAGFGIRLTTEIAQKLGFYPEDQEPEDGDLSLTEALDSVDFSKKGFSWGECGSYYSGRVKQLLLTTGGTLGENIESAKKMVEFLLSHGVIDYPTYESLEWISETLWS